MIAITFSNGQVNDRFPGWTELLPEAKEVCLLGLSLQANFLHCISVSVNRYRIVVVGWCCIYGIKQTKESRLAFIQDQKNYVPPNEEILLSLFLFLEI